MKNYETRSYKMATLTKEGVYKMSTKEYNLLVLN
jgi:hypothetical protein